MRFSIVIGQFAYCLHLIALRFCICHGLNRLDSRWCCKRTRTNDLVWTRSVRPCVHDARNWSKILNEERINQSHWSSDRII